MKTLRCMAYRQDGVFVAVCLDLSLAAQADSMQEATDKLESQVHDYLEEVFSEPEYAKQMLNRKAPFTLWVKYWLIAFRMMFKKQSNLALFSEPCKVHA
ncbi:MULTISPECIES: DUF1902 domain-containing protein [unclassified Tatumella]|uniref:DUF1902 domain-containing protein n=1 Tax=unclassified Tatumella TaxID=2649542 RepID=UPI001BAF514E|nr:MULTISPECIES: DUF1902 domain-containing protein [unclassified Tatumella]MBS0854943.1 DUF1902 domain-containing protein [Tatumella sp. JGM16]MBS0912095.1 DUF1902 domain-containing protein [Tatumella sp. JGM91]